MDGILAAVIGVVGTPVMAAAVTVVVRWWRSQKRRRRELHAELAKIRRNQKVLGRSCLQLAQRVRALEEGNGRSRLP